ncbi:DUF4853 domain-containing protein [Schaalia vaccimaxillae]|uniref:DUF4853 domain-containing protein n=1 Tax=Schaalia vaccimaxillae TaxID=183916 RepID=UPI0003B6F96C|nr:DUF4853 domain-containing protein [Schaalia vaccimaxillae]
MADEMTIVAGDFEALAQKIDAVESQLAPVQVSSALSTIGLTLPGGRSVSAVQTVANAVDGEGWDIGSRMYEVGEVDGEVIVRLSKEFLQPVGFDHLVHLPPDRGLESYDWYDRQDGGRVTLIHDLSSHTLRIIYTSACRPSDGSTVRADQFVQGYDPLGYFESEGLVVVAEDLTQPQSDQSGH